VKWPPAWDPISGGLAVESSSARESEKRRHYSSVDKSSIADIRQRVTTLAREAEDFLLLESIVRERLVKTAGWKRLTGCCCDF
jgi:hypothetical protein